MNLLKILSVIVFVFVAPIAALSFLNEYRISYAIDLQNPALGRNTSIRFGSSFNNDEIHCGGARAIETCIQTLKNTDKTKKKILWIGNSQLHSINQMQDDDLLSIEIVSKNEAASASIVAISFPNLNYGEAAEIFSLFVEEIEIDILILGIVFDDFREFGIRPDIFKQLGANKHEADSKTVGIFDLELLESYLSTRLEAISTLWKDRDELRKFIIFNIYKTRNWLFNISAQTERPLIPSFYQSALESLTSIAMKSQERGIDFLLYLAPLRSDIAPPYERDEYNQFQTDILELSAQLQIPLKDLSSIVPVNCWGTTGYIGEDEIDFMHFSGCGHQVLAREIERYIDDF
jgi:hypothetical protein